MQFKILALFLAIAFVVVNSQGVAAPALTSLASKIGWLENSNNPQKTELIQSAESAYSRISAALAIQTSAPTGSVSGADTTGAGATGAAVGAQSSSTDAAAGGVAATTSSIESAASSAAEATSSVAEASSSAHGVVNSLESKATSIAAAATSAVGDHTSAGVRVASDLVVQMTAIAGLIVATCVALMA
ncbi:hypothetical protein J3Q64DRAFT_1843586 [Phycomyces blakesleeanus]|uniref:Uncharacterized protein n=1 Tax=Phycomyces blakesleeanus TaxID=4837 RepID=A0ABR3BEK5_PHYBL